MKLNQWTIIVKDDIETYIIGLNINGKLYKSSYIENYMDINNRYIKLKTEDDEIELLHNELYRPTYLNKKLYRWDIINSNDDSVSSSNMRNISRYYDKVKFENNCYHVNDIRLDLDELMDIFEDRRLEGYRDREVNKRDIFETTYITHIKLYPKYIEVFTESGSNYLLYLSELYQ